MSALIVNFFGGPGSRKSTLAATCFAELKWRGINCEYATEYAKDKTWEESFGTLDNQVYVFGKQHHRLWRCKDKVDVIFCDSPLLLSLIYGKNRSTEFEEMVLKEFHGCNNLNFFVQRRADYNPSGRSQTHEQAKTLDSLVWNMLIDRGINFTTIPGVRESSEIVLTEVQKIVKKIPHFKCTKTGKSVY